MKALKKEYLSYTEQIIALAGQCYECKMPNNTELMALYSHIGKQICQQGEKAFVVYLSEVFAEKLPQLKGFSPRNLRRMRDFYKTYESNSELMEKAQALSWTQNTVILECCENNEQHLFYTELAIANSLSKLALIEAIKEQIYEQALEDETATNASKDCSHLVADFSGNEGSNTAQAVKNDCRAFVPRCEPLRQGIGASHSPSRAFRYMGDTKLDNLYRAMLRYVQEGIWRSFTVVKLLQSVRHSIPPPEIFRRNKIPILLF